MGNIFSNNDREEKFKLNEKKKKEREEEIYQILKTIEINDDGILDLTNIDFEIPSNMFEEKMNIKKIIFGKDVKGIDSNAFRKCLFLEEIDFSYCENLKFIHCRCFQYCQNLKSITFPKCLFRIGELAFDKCSSLKVINFMYDDYHYYSKNAFSRCFNLTNIYFIDGNFENYSPDLRELMNKIIYDVPNVKIDIPNEFKKHIPLNNQFIENIILK